MVKFHRALDADGRLFRIDEVTKENRAKHYTCVGCGGEMEAVLGNRREHHFRHKGDTCSLESYLHKLGKRCLRERFNSQEDFTVQFPVQYSCNSAGKCKFCSASWCNRQETCTIDLKKLYDTCEEEKEYGGYRADLMLSSKEYPERAPVFLEIHVANECSTEKRESGIQIIEIDVKEETDVESPIVESPSIRFYGFKREFEAVQRLSRFCVTCDANGILRFHPILNDLTCHNLEDNHRDGSIYEVAIPTGDIRKLIEIGLIKAGLARLNFKYCYFCDRSRYCNCIRTSKIDFFALAQKCKYFHNGLDWDRMWKSWRSFPCHEWKK